VEGIKSSGSAINPAQTLDLAAKSRCHCGTLAGRGSVMNFAGDRTSVKIARLHGSFARLAA
jgi:hypothetical protein